MKNIALCMELSDFYEHGIAKGVVRYAKATPEWRLFGYGWMFRPLADLDAWKGDGIIARIESPGDADRIAALGVPVIDVAGAYLRPGIMTVANDDFLTGYKAALHLRSCGFENFAFLGVRETFWSDERKKGFLRGIGKTAPGKVDDEVRIGGIALGKDCRLPSFERPLSWWEGASEGNQREKDGAAPGGFLGELGAFLLSLEKPVAIFACNDTAGMRAAEVAGSLGVSIPDSLAILGVDDEDILCEFASPSLSSVRLDCEAIGYRAAQTLDAILKSGGAAPNSRIAIPPKEVVERESTRVYTCPDPLVATAATFIRARAHEGIGVPDLLAVLPCSRRALENRFRAALGRSLHEEIIRVRLVMAKRLLRETDLALEYVAERCGFGSLPRFRAAFRASEGTTPGAWRSRKEAFL